MRTQEFNVRDYGAKGDGIADDTAAINAAFDDVRKAGVVTNPELCRQPEWFPGTCPSVVFPCGYYKISGEINISGVFERLEKRDTGVNIIRGDNAVIEQCTQDKDIFVSKYSMVTHIMGFKFVYGRNQVWLDNPNIGGNIKVTDCEFYEARGVAVIFGYQCHSTFAYLANCVFVNCEQLVYAMSDVVVIRDLNGSNRSGTKNKAAFDLRGGFVTLDNVMATPWCDGLDQRWIDNRSAMLKLINCRFGGEAGGILTVRNFRKYDKLCSMSIIIDNCFLPNQTNLKRQCVVYCDEVPNRIIVKNSGIVGIPVIMVDKSIDLRNYFKGLRAGMLDFAVEHCTGQIGDMPKLLKHPVIVKDAGSVALSDKDLKRRLKAAVKKNSNGKEKRNPQPPAVYGKHREQTEASKYMNIPFRHWTAEGYADAEGVPNANYYALAAVDDGVLIMKKQRAAGNGWALVKDVPIDLDRFAYLSYRVRPLAGWNVPFAMRILDKTSGNSLLFSPNCYAGAEAPAYCACNLREFFGGGKRVFDIRVYAFNAIFCPRAEVPNVFKTAERFFDGEKMLYVIGEGDMFIIGWDAGAYNILEYMRAEVE